MAVYKTDANKNLIKVAGNFGLVAKQITAGATFTNQNDTVVEYSVSTDGIWYRKWKSGWKECGGRYATVNSQSRTVTLPLTFSSTSYTVICSFADNTGYPLRYAKVTNENQVYFEVSASGNKWVHIYCCGY